MTIREKYDLSENQLFSWTAIFGEKTQHNKVKVYNKLIIPFCEQDGDIMSEIYGYARCSTNENRQDIDRQKRELRKLGVDKEENVYAEYGSGTKDDRPELTKLLKIIKPGDTIVATEVSRLSRSTKQLCEIIEFVQHNHLKLVIGNFVVDCREADMDPMTKGMIMMWSVFAEMERDMISERVKSGMANARAKGKTIGRPEVTVEDLSAAFWKAYGLYRRGDISISEMARMLGCSRGTVYKYIAIAEEEK